MRFAAWQVGVQGGVRQAIIVACEPGTLGHALVIQLALLDGPWRRCQQEPPLSDDELAATIAGAKPYRGALIRPPTLDCKRSICPGLNREATRLSRGDKVHSSQRANHLD